MHYRFLLPLPLCLHKHSFLQAHTSIPTISLASPQRDVIACVHLLWHGAQQVKNQPAMQETQEMLGLADPLEEETETQLQYSCLKNPMDRGA